VPEASDKQGTRELFLHGVLSGPVLVVFAHITRGWMVHLKEGNLGRCRKKEEGEEGNNLVRGCEVGMTWPFEGE
jgi:hypothetical protein